VVQVRHTVNDLVDEVGCIPLRVVALCCHSTAEKGTLYHAAFHVPPAGRCIIQCTRTNLSSSSPPDTSSVTMKTRFSVSQTAWSFMQWGWSTCYDSSTTSSRRGRRKQNRIVSMTMMGPDFAGVHKTVNYHFQDVCLSL
jgi:hypothetical protein